jgi:hypothetical protein
VLPHASTSRRHILRMSIWDGMLRMRRCYACMGSGNGPSAVIIMVSALGERGCVSHASVLSRIGAMPGGGNISLHFTSTSERRERRCGHRKFFLPRRYECFLGGFDLCNRYATPPNHPSGAKTSRSALRIPRIERGEPPAPQQPSWPVRFIGVRLESDPR